jgi:cold shock protein
MAPTAPGPGWLRHQLIAPSARRHRSTVVAAGVTQSIVVRRYPLPEHSVAGVVKWFDADEGWGVIAAPDVPGDCFVHFSCIEAEGYRELRAGQQVRFTCEDPGFPQDGCRFRALMVWPEI